ncbi:hypothetical protein OE749_13760 [Aestuariibacter sp. AA17]|uniref:Uncharacterized protein n=1 Tax=Fluctibacter corallii TaxID=2984329 RepID=A0ABT3AAX2_9ALTE|nr:hypothetical protein [Aestuariibacter sp. AA17]MCV2885759.1 hypothetical protein [Aestuariibacter sp. AA17]
MMKESLEKALCRCFKKGVSLTEARHVCIALYCSASYLPSVNSSELNKSNIAKVFSELAKTGLVRGLGCNNSDSFDSDYWLGQIDEAFKRDNFYDKNIVTSILG